jgi:hypothetical protein
LKLAAFIARSEVMAGAICATMLLLVALSTPAWAQRPAGAGKQSAAAPAVAPPPDSAPAPKAKLENLEWLAGRWRGEWGPRVAEQTWFAPEAGMMVGTFRLVENDKTLVIEVFTLVEKADGINFYFRHFTPELVPWEKSEATLLRLASLDPKKVDFENPINGLPKHAIFLRVDSDTYISRSEIVPAKGDPQVTEITYHRQKPAPEKPSAGSGGRR